MSATAAAPFPRLQLASVITVLACVLVGVTVARFTGYADAPRPGAGRHTGLALQRFGRWQCRRRQRHERCHHQHHPARGGGFIRSTMRVLATMRAHDNIGPATPIRA